MLVEVEVEDVNDLKIGAVHQHQVAADENVCVVRGRRWKHDLYFMRAGLHVRTHTDRQNSMHHQEPFLSGRQPIALGKSGWQMVVMVVIPAAEIAIMLAIFFVSPLIAVVTIGMTVAMVVVAIMMVITIVFVITVLMILRRGDRC